MVLKARETKRYEFEAVNSEQAFEIVHKIVPSMILGLLTVANFDECVQQSIVHTLPGAMNLFFFLERGVWVKLELDASRYTCRYSISITTVQKLRTWKKTRSPMYAGIIQHAMDYSHSTRTIVIARPSIVVFRTVGP